MPTTEKWLPVGGTDGRYEVSDQGRLRKNYKSCIRMIEGYRRASGYRIVSIDGKQILRHVVVATAFHGPSRPGQVCRHLNGVAGDDRLENLQWGTPAENAADSKRHGTNYALNKTHCKWGHEFTQDNTFIDNLGRRICRTCKAKHARREVENIARRRRVARIARWTFTPGRVVHGRTASGELLVSYCGPCYYLENHTTGKRVRLPAAEFHSLANACQRSAA